MKNEKNQIHVNWKEKRMSFYKIINYTKCHEVLSYWESLPCVEEVIKIINDYGWKKTDIIIAVDFDEHVIFKNGEWVYEGPIFFCKDGEWRYETIVMPKPPSPPSRSSWWCGGQFKTFCPVGRAQCVK
jgi:hypothetical protein